VHLIVAILSLNHYHPNTTTTMQLGASNKALKDPSSSGKPSTTQTQTSSQTTIRSSASSHGAVFF
jgi:hypothetical protein